MKKKEKKGTCKATAVPCAVSGRHLSRQPRWRDKAVHPRHRDTNAGHSRLSETTARQNALVAPMAVARQRGPVAPHALARQVCPCRLPAWRAQRPAASVAALSRHADWRDRG